MKKILLFLTIFVILILGISFLIFFKKQSQKAQEFESFPPPPPKVSFKEKTMIQEKLKKKVALILAFRDFRDEEYFEPKEILEKEGIEIFTVSTQEGIAQGVQGGEAKVDILIDNLNVEDFDGIIFVGGPGMVKNIENEKFHQIAREALEKNKVLGAICIAPAILAKAKVLQGKKATVWSSPLDKSAIEILKENGAEFLSQSVVRDGKIITANGPLAAKDFAKEILSALRE